MNNVYFEYHNANIFFYENTFSKAIGRIILTRGELILTLVF